jgi:hypothetical protein
MKETISQRSHEVLNNNTNTKAVSDIYKYLIFDTKTVLICVVDHSSSPFNSQKENN